MLSLSERKIIGLTGMSGAGKSTVSRTFAQCGYTVIDCDLCAREASEDKNFLAEISRRFYPDVLDPDGTLNRRRTADRIFNSGADRALYNRIIYPYITYIIIGKIREADNDVLLDAPTLFEARLDWLCNGVVSVCADVSVCAERICARDGLTPGQAAARLSSQHDAAFFRRISDMCIENNGSHEELISAARAAAEKMKGVG